METKDFVNIEKKSQTVQLIKGTFKKSEALDVITALIDEKVNFHKIQRLQFWEGDHDCKTDILDQRINELLEEKRVIKEFIKEASDLGFAVKIDGVLEISISK